MGRDALQAAKQIKPIATRAKNVILFVGDGMGISTVTAAGILEGQLHGASGEGNRLSFETFPFVALSQTYSANQQTSDSAPTMTALVTGVKTNDGFLSVDQRARRDDAASVNGRRLPTILEQAKARGLAAGLVTTTRVTHATPGATYAHTVERDWECDADQSQAANGLGFPDIARQLIEFRVGGGIDVVFGGGRSKFTPTTDADSEYVDKKGERHDHRNLIQEWLDAFAGAAYVWNQAQFDALDPAKAQHVLGLFEPSHMHFEHDRAKDGAGEPSLAQMTAKAIAILSRNPKGFFLMVEGGRIDHAHHAANAYRALTETIAFSDAVKTAAQQTDSNDTLIIVTADHSHTMTIGGYPKRGNPILGKVVAAGGDGEYSKDATGLPYTTLNYANGAGYTGASAEQKEGTKRFEHHGRGYRLNRSGRPDLTNVDTTDPDYLQESVAPLSSETHGGEDVAIYARGPMAHLVHGVLEQHVVYYIMSDALGLLDE